MVAYQEFITLGDFLRLGLPPEALRSARTTHAPIVRTGAGAGVVVPSGNLDVALLEVDQLAGVVEIVTGGAVGVATWRWSADAGATWSTPAPASTTPASLVLPWGLATGVVLRFSGTLVTGATYAWTSVSAVATCRRAANDELSRYLVRQFALPLSEVPQDVIRDGCAIMAADVMAVTGYRPSDGADELLEKRAAGARKRFDAVVSAEVQPRATEGGTQVRGPRVATGTRR